jgi:type I restriction enzyme, S subunit
MSDWSEISLDKVVALKRGFDLPEPQRRPGPYPVLGSSGISGWHDEGPVKGPGVTIGRSGAIGAATYFEGDYWPLNTTLFAADFKGNSPHYVYYLLDSIDFASFNSGSAQPSLNRNYIANIRIRLPVREEQEAIAGLLGALDDKIAVNERIARVCRELIAVKYNDAVASGVKSVQISDVAEVYDGPHATPRKTKSGPWFLSISSLSRGRLMLDQSAHLSEDDFKQWTRRVTPRFGDVLFSYETRLGDAASMPAGIRACLGRRMALLRPREIGSRTLLQAFLSPSFQENIRQYSIHGATVDRIPLTEFPSWRIELPARDPWQLESILGPLDDLAQQRDRENGTLADLRDTLLPKLMSGEVRLPACGLSRDVRASTECAG